jgi:DNA-binding CsgD family transcriptional regulator
MTDNLKEGRAHYRRRAWRDAYRSLSLADETGSLGADDLELLATSAYLVGREDDFDGFLSRAYREHLDAGDELRGARCAFWLGLMRMFRGDTGQGGAWLARAGRLVEGRDCAERGYLMLAVAERHLGSGDGVAAHAAGTDAADIGARFEDADLICCARHLQGRALIKQEKVQPGLTLLDDAMLGAVSGELSPMMAGLVYCSLVEACRDVFALERAREWTAALSRWCDAQPQLAAFTGVCLLHRARIKRLNGRWLEADTELVRARERFSLRGDANPPGMVFYERGELHRLRGEFAEAEETYRAAARRGFEPQPGLALLRMAQGRADAACASIRRALSSVKKPLRRAVLLPACIEILLGSGMPEDAEALCQELTDIAERYDTPALHAMAAQASGALAIALGSARSGLVALRRAFELWCEVDAPYEAARTRVQLGVACRLAGDDEAGEMELAAAKETFEDLGAVTDLQALSILTRPPTRERHPLTARELEVLRLVADGKTNKSIAVELCVSDRTIDRHVSNIFMKLNVTSRAAATAYAYRHGII